MRIAFVVNSDFDNRAGYFNAVHSKIKNLSIPLEKKRIFTIRFYDDWFLSLLRRFASKKKVSVDQRSHFEYDGLTYEYLYLKRSIFSMLLWKLGAVFKAIRSEMSRDQIRMFRQFDLISAHWGDSCGNLACAVSQKLDIPVTVTYHGSDIHSIPEWRRNRVLSNLKSANMNIFVSRFLETEARKICPQMSVSRVIYNSVESEFLKGSNAVDIGKKSKDEIRVGYLGAFIPLKGVLDLPKIAKKLQELTDATVKLTLLGEGELRSVLEQQLSQEGICVEFVGMVERSKVREYIREMDVVVLPSKKEGLGLVLLEAIALGVPAIGSDVGGISEVVGSDYVVAPGYNFEGRFAQKIKDVLALSESQVISSQFSEEVATKQEYELYLEMLDLKV